MRVVSLVPSLTEAVAPTLPGVLVGGTDWCIHPADLTVTLVGSSKYPDLDRVLAPADMFRATARTPFPACPTRCCPADT